MKKIGQFIAILVLCVTYANATVAEQQEVKNNFLTKIERVIEVVQDKKIDAAQRNSKIVEMLTPMFDFTLMAKLSLGNEWKKLSSSDQKSFVSLYVNRMKRSYSEKIDAYSDEKVEITQINQPKSNRIELITNLLSNEESLEIVYKYYKPKTPKNGKENWLIYDVVILGVSILKTDKAQFREFLQTKTIQELMVQLKQ